MVVSLTSLNPSPFSFSNFIQSNWKTVAFLVGGLFFTCIVHMIYSKPSPPQKRPPLTWEELESSLTRIEQHRQQHVAQTMVNATYQAHLQYIAKQLSQLPPPNLASTSPDAFKVHLNGECYSFSSLEDLGKHSAYFSAFKRQSQSSCTLDNNSAPEIEDLHASLSLAFSYLQGNPIDLQDPYALLQAASFLQIPRLILLCEQKLLQLAEKGELNFEDFTPEDLALFKKQTPSLHTAFFLTKTQALIKDKQTGQP